MPVRLHIDGTDRDIETEAATVRVILRDMGVQLGKLDRVEPPLWTPLRAGMYVTVTRMVEEREERVITTAVRIIRDEFLSPDESIVLNEGSDGIEELVYRISYDGARVLNRELVERHVVVEPREKVRLIGTKGSIPSVPISGTIAYVSNGDAWVMRGESGRKRPLTRGSNLDGRVFDLSPDGRELLYTDVPTATPGVFNALWVMDTEVLNASPRFTGIRDVRWAAWSPDGERFAYSSAVVSRGLATTSQGAPGWRALNDLHLVAWPTLSSTQVLSPTTVFIYSWWGETWTWAADGQRLAYAHGDSLGFVDLRTAERRPLYTFRPFHTHGDWVWLPTIAWAPDGSRLAACVHQGGEEEPSFALLLFDVDTEEVTELAHDVGPWAGPAWSASRDELAFGLPTEAMEGAESYQLYHVPANDWDHLTPVSPKETATVPFVELSWAPSGPKLILVHDGDLYLFDLDRGTAQPLTATGLASRPRWR